MKVDTTTALGTQVIGAAVFGYSGYLISGQSGTAAGLFAIAGWGAGIAAVNYVFNEGKLTRQFAQEMNRPKQSVHTNIILPEHDGYTPRISTDIPEDYFYMIGRYVMNYNPKNLTQDVIRAAISELSQEQARALHSKLVGLLSGYKVGVINTKGESNHHEITDPVGRSFFNTLSHGKLSALRRYSIPYTPSVVDALKNIGSTQHARPTRPILGEGWQTL